MKIPKSLKLPRKLKKEVKKGFTRNVMPHYPVFNPVCRENGISLNMYETVSYSGSNTKSFRRLCKYTRKDEQRVYQKMINDEINKQFDWLDDVSDIKTFTIDHLKQFQRKMFCEPIPKPTIGNVTDYWKDTTIQLSFTKAILPILP